MHREKDPNKSISVTQVAASALAASSAAFAASYLGVAGTIIGAALASVVATVATATYSASLQRSREAVRSRLVAWQPGVPVLDGPVPDPNAPAALEEQAEPQRGSWVPASWGVVAWRRIALTAGAALLVTIVTLTGVEGIIGKPIASLLGRSDSSGTSLKVAVDGGGSPKKKESGRAQVVQPEPTPTTEPTAEPSGEPTATPTDGATSEPTAEPSSTPTTGPTPTPAPGVDPTVTPTP